MSSVTKVLERAHEHVRLWHKFSVTAEKIMQKIASGPYIMPEAESISLGHKGSGCS